MLETHAWSAPQYQSMRPPRCVSQGMKWRNAGHVTQITSSYTIVMIDAATVRSTTSSPSSESTGQNRPRQTSRMATEHLLPACLLHGNLRHDQPERCPYQTLSTATKCQLPAAQQPQAWSAGTRPLPLTDRSQNACCQHAHYRATSARTLPPSGPQHGNVSSVANMPTTRQPQAWSARILASSDPRHGNGTSATGMPATRQPAPAGRDTGGAKVFRQPRQPTRAWRPSCTEPEFPFNWSTSWLVLGVQRPVN